MMTLFRRWKNKVARMLEVLTNSTVTRKEPKIMDITIARVFFHPRAPSQVIWNREKFRETAMHTTIGE